MSIRGKLNRSPINYLSELFVIAMVAMVVVVLVVSVPQAVWLAACRDDTTLWEAVLGFMGTLLAACGGGWMVKVAAQHAICNFKGGEVRPDFPAVEDCEMGEREQPVADGEAEEEGEEDDDA